MEIGLALGSGSARGWSHIGVIRALADLGVKPAIICGSSFGALIGASYVAKNLDKLEAWAHTLTRLETVRFFEIKADMNGFVNTKRFHNFLKEFVAEDDLLIEDFLPRYAAVSTELETGREVWLSKGLLIEAVWASISLPGLFPAIRNNNKWLIDGGLVNPVPVTVCRALGADIVVAVNLNGDIVGKFLQKEKSSSKPNSGVVGKITDFVAEYTPTLFTKNKYQSPSLFEAIAGSINITQDRITRSRMAGDPPDILLSPKLSQIGLLEFYRAAEAIAEGRRCVQRMQSEIQHVLDMNGMNSH